MKTSDEGVLKIHNFEKFMAVAYLCPAGKPTIGYGTTRGVTLADVGVRTITQPEAVRLAALDLVDCESTVNRLCTVLPTQTQFDALVCLVYNIGGPQFAASSVLRAHNRGDFVAAGRAFGLYNKYRKVPDGPLIVSNGLTIRRAGEAAVYLSSLTESAPELMPQIVEPESKLTASPINRASVIAGGTAALASTNEIITAISDVKEGVAGLGEWLLPVALVAIVIACGYVVYTRWLQRREGWA